MQRYSEYKNSGIYFIPNIPRFWHVLKAKYLFNQEKREVRPEDEIVTCFRDGQVTLRKNRRTEGFTNSMKEIGYQGVRKGDLVIHNMDAFAGAIGISDSDGKGTPVYACCTPKREDVNQYYYCYLLRYLARSGFILSLAKGIRERSTDFRFNDFKGLYLPVPPREEQNAMVAYLDTVTAKIDIAITQQQKMIDLLNERKQIIINNAITKGLDSNVKMKDSGVEWIGKIPKHWEVRKLKSITSKIGSGVTPRGGGSVYVDRGVMFLRSQNVYFEGFKLEDVVYITEDVDASMPNTRVREGDILFNITGGSIGRCHYVPQGFPKANVNQHVSIIRPNNFSSVYLYYLLRSPICQIQVDLQQTGGNREGLTAFSLKNFILPIPPKNEQQNIIKYLSEVDLKLEYAKQNFQKQIFLLQERKQIIINDVVTGKVKVI